RKIAIPRTGKGRNDPARFFDHRKHAALLPYGEGLPLLYAHFQAMRIDLAHRNILDPRKRLYALPRRIDVKTYKGRPAIQPEFFQHVDLGRLAIAHHPDLLHGEAGARGDALHEAVKMAPKVTTIEQA